MCPGQFLTSSVSRRYHWILKMLLDFFCCNLEIKDLKHVFWKELWRSVKESMIFLKKVNINKNETEPKMENPTYVFRKMSFELQFIWESWMKNSDLKLAKEKSVHFSSVHFAVRKVLNKPSKYVYFYISKNTTSYVFLLVFKVVKSLQCILKSSFLM